MLRKKPLLQAVVKIEIKNFAKTHNKLRPIEGICKVFSIWDATQIEVRDVLYEPLKKYTLEKTDYFVRVDIKFFPSQTEPAPTEATKIKYITLYGVTYLEVVKIIDSTLDAAVEK